MKRLLPLFLALLLLAGCVGKVPCDEYVAGAVQLQRAAKAFPAHAALLNQCIDVAKLSGQLCLAGQAVDPTLYQRCMNAVGKLAEAAPGPQGKAQAPEPTPTPAPTDTGDSGASRALKNDVDPATITFVQGPDIGKWPITHDLAASLSGNNVLLKQSATSTWPAKLYQDKPLVGNSWVVANISGKWYGASFEWLAKGAQSRGKYTVAGDHIKYPRAFPADWRPKVGETIYVCVASLSRGGMRSVDERTPFKKIVWE